jgi:glycosyltransferase involved in cell wall biosynthesis
MKLSACLITAGEPSLERAIASIRPHVDEVCVLLAAPIVGLDERAAIRERLRDLADRYVETEWNDPAYSPTSGLLDFSAARRTSFDLATPGSAIVWLDSDDEVEGAEHLRDAVRIAAGRANGKPWRAIFPYEYQHNERGECIVEQHRERIISDRDAFVWQRPVHEGLVKREGVDAVDLHDLAPIRWVHHPAPESQRDRGRNLRILKHWRKVAIDRGEKQPDVRTLFDIGIELLRNGQHGESAQALQHYYLQSRCDDERVVAALHLCDLYLFWPGHEESASHWAREAVRLRPEWPDGWFALAKINRCAAKRDADLKDRRLARAAAFAREGLSRKPAKTLWPTNPNNHRVDMPLFLADIEEERGNYIAALDAAKLALRARPADPAILIQVHDLALAHDPRTDVVIAAGPTFEQWDATTPSTTGIGGSETAVVEMAKRLVDRGCRVRVFCNCPEPGIYDGVEYRNLSDIDAVSSCDLLIAWRYAAHLENVPARVKWIWAHDTQIAATNEWNLHLADRVLALSDWHAKELAQKYPAASAKITKTRNGIDLARFAITGDMHRNPRRALYTSSHDRGLAQLLDLWPRVRAEVPDAELHVFYAQPDDVPDVEGVVYRGRANQIDLAREMLAAGVWVHPSWCPNGDAWTETSCIGAMEAQAAGMRLVCTPHGALGETAFAAAQFIDTAAPDETWARLFSQAIVDAMISRVEWDRTIHRSNAAIRFSWDDVADEWINRLVADLAAVPPANPRRIHAADGYRFVDLDNFDARPILHMTLAPQASGSVIMDPASSDFGAEAQGGGCRAGFIGLAKAMAARGYRVRAFSTFKNHRAERDGVEWLRLDELRRFSSPTTKPDVFLAYYDTSPLEDAPEGVLRIASHHTYTPYEHFDATDVNTAPSEHSMAYLRERCDPATPWHVLPNGVADEGIVRNTVAGRVIYHTSPDRGLHHLLAAWPAIRAKVPHATLHVVGPVEESLAHEAPTEEMRARQVMLRDGLADARDAGGVELLGRVPRQRLRQELSEAACFAFPFDAIAPCETFSASVMECCIAGVPVVLVPGDSLAEIYEGAVRMATHAGFADAVTDTLLNEPRDAINAGRLLGCSYTFENEAEVLDGIIRKHSKMRLSVERVDHGANGHAAIAM